WLTMKAQRQNKPASAMVLTIASKDSTDEALSKGLSLFGRKFKVQYYLTFGADTQCNKYLAFFHHSSQCTRPTHCTICSQEHPIHIHTCRRSDCTIKAKMCLYTTIQCINCKDSHQATSQKCPTYIVAY
ncbi:hypothetical protein L873DRAFT_1679543, partial [Choiromyces venosus 120613-1]